MLVTTRSLQPCGRFVSPISDARCMVFRCVSPNQKVGDPGFKDHSKGCWMDDKGCLHTLPCGSNSTLWKMLVYMMYIYIWYKCLGAGEELVDHSFFRCWYHHLGEVSWNVVLCVLCFVISVSWWFLGFACFFNGGFGKGWRVIRVYFFFRFFQGGALRSCWKSLEKSDAWEGLTTVIPLIGKEKYQSTRSCWGHVFFWQVNRWRLYSLAIWGSQLIQNLTNDIESKSFTCYILMDEWTPWNHFSRNFDGWFWSIITSTKKMLVHSEFERMEGH